MSSKEQQRQKKLAKKRSKEIARKKETARQKNVMQSFSGQMKAAATGPVDRCFISDRLLDPEMRFGTVVISRKLPSGKVGCVRFLVDGMCLGVKDVHGFFCFPAQLTDLIDENHHEELRPCSPAAARKLVEGAIAFAQQFDFQPHPDYRKVEPIWSGIDASECLTKYEFGDNGKPVYVSGPNDDSMRSYMELAKLQQNLGSSIVEIDRETAVLLADSEDRRDVDIDADVIDTTAVQKR